jgi:membrane-associated phospholipid phosphatase
VVDGAITLGAAATGLALALPRLQRSGCEWCEPGPVDVRLQNALRWQESPDTARVVSDVLASGVVPAAAVLETILSARAAGRPREALVDLALVAEATTIATVSNELAKDLAARRRPEGGNRSFYSGHTSLAFSVATSAGTIASLRGYPGAPWFWAGGMTLATAVGYLRVAGDAHWTTDVVAGAAAGGLIGFAVPWLHRSRRSRIRWALTPGPRALALTAWR